MSANINLVDKSTSEDSKSEKTKKIKGISFSILALTALLAIIIFAIDYRFSASYVRKQQADLLNEISQSQDKTAKIFIRNSKLTDISTILNQRKKYNSVTSSIAAASSGGVTFDEYSIEEAGITLTVSANSLTSIDEFLNSILELTRENVVTSVLINRFAFESNRYVVELSML